VRLSIIPHKQTGHGALLIDDKNWTGFRWGFQLHDETVVATRTGAGLPEQLHRSLDAGFARRAAKGKKTIHDTSSPFLPQRAE
jgi:hypothetical protein